MVVVSDQVQDTMDNYPIQFVLELSPIEGRVLPDGVDTDEEVAVQAVAFAVVERNDIREVIVLQILYFMFTSRM